MMTGSPAAPLRPSTGEHPQCWQDPVCAARDLGRGRDRRSAGRSASPGGRGCCSACPPRDAGTPAKQDHGRKCRAGGVPDPAGLSSPRRPPLLSLCPTMTRTLMISRRSPFDTPWEIVEPRGMVRTADVLDELIARDDGSPWARWWEGTSPRVGSRVRRLAWRSCCARSGSGRNSCGSTARTSAATTPATSPTNACRHTSNKTLGRSKRR